MIYVDVDELTPCLKDVSTGEMIDTEVIRIKRKSFLQKYNKKNGWYTSWDSLLKDYEVYALVIKGTVDIQGLVALKDDKEMGALYIAWMVAAPFNNYHFVDQKRYSGVGGHLFAIAATKSEEYGYGCEMMGFAATKQLEDYYVEAFGAERIHMLHPYQIVIPAESGRQIKEVYTYEWTDEEI